MPWKSVDPARPLPWLRRGARMAGWGLAALGAAGLTGWASGFARLLQPVSGFPPASPAESLAILIIGLALADLAADHHRIALLGGASLATSGFVSLARHLAAIGATSWQLPAVESPLALLRLPASTALLLGVSGAGLLAVGLPLRVDRGRLGAGACGVTLVVLTLGIMAARMVWQADVSGGLLVDSSLQLLLTALGLGLCLAASTWAKNPAVIDAPGVPLAIGLASLVTAVLLWRAFIDYDREQVRAQTRGAAQGAVQQVGRQVEFATRTLARVARFSPSPWPRTREGENRVVTLTRDVDGLKGLAWVGPGAQFHQVLPEQLDSDSLRDELAARLSQALHLATPGTSPLPRYFPLSAPAGFAIAVPLCAAGPCSGHVIGLFDATGMLSPILADSSGGFLFAVTADRRSVLAPPGRLAVPQGWSMPSSFALDQLRWDIVTWPSAQTLARARSGLPDLLLLAGLLVSSLLPLTIRLSQLNLSRASLAERARLQEAIETATDGIWEWDVDTGTTRRSDALWRHLGYDPEAMNGRPDPWPWLIHPGDQWRVMKSLAAHLAGDSPTFEARYRIRSLGGDWHWMIDRGRVVEWTATGTPHRVLGISADITERLRADEERAASERRFRVTFDSARQLQLLLDHEGRVLEANRAAIEFAGELLSTMRGKRLWALRCWQGETGEAGQVAECITTALSGTAVERELELVDREGEPLLLELTLSPIKDGDGQVSQLLVDARDTTIRRRAEDALREVESLTTMGRIAARVAHEINNPLAGIQNAFLLIKDAIPDDHPHYAYVGAVEREITRIAAVTRQLYETYRPEQDQVQGTSLASLVGDAVALLQQVNRAAGVRIEVDLRRAPGTVPLPEAILRQALYNLVQNAVEASAPGGVVEVVAAIEGGMFSLAVGDRGAGIPDDIRDRVFEPFFTTKGATVRTGGMGLGLSLVARSVQALGGRVDIHDRAGGGTLVVVRLPLPAPSGVTA